MKIAVFRDVTVYGLVDVVGDVDSNHCIFCNLCSHQFENLRSYIIVLLFLVNVFQRYQFL
jgi:hypothetical protein